MNDTALKIVPPDYDTLLGYENAQKATQDGNPVLIAETEEVFNALDGSYGLPAIFPRGGEWLASHGQLVIGMELVFVFSTPERRIKAAKVFEDNASRIIILDEQYTGHETLEDYIAEHGVNGAGDKLYDLTFTRGRDYEYREEEATRAAIIPLEGQQITQEAYPIEALGPIMGEITKAIVSNVQVSVPLAAQSVLGVAALTSQQFADVQPPYFNAKTIPCSAYLLTEAGSGERKSAANNAALAPLFKWQRHLGETYEYLMEEYRQTKSAYDKMVTKAENKAKSIQDAKQAIAAIGDAPKQPLSPSLILNEPTIEGFLKSASTSHAGRAIITDEAGAFLGGHSMTSEKKQYTVTTLSKLWDAADIVMARVGRDTPPIRNKRLTMHLMGQSVIINPLLADPLAQGQGFLARFLTVSAPPRAGFRELKTRATPADYHALNAWTEHIYKILASRTVTMREGTQNELKPLILTLDDDAFTVWRDYAEDVEKAQRPEGKYEDIKPFASKAAEHALRMAGIFTVIEKEEGQSLIDADIMRRAVELIRFYADEHLRLVKQCSADPRLTGAAQLIEWIKGNRSRYVYKNDLRQNAPRSTRRGKGDLEQNLDTLCDHKHIKAIDPKTIDGAMRQNCYEVLA